MKRRIEHLERRLDSQNSVLTLANQRGQSTGETAFQSNAIFGVDQYQQFHSGASCSSSSSSSNNSRLQTPLGSSSLPTKAIHSAPGGLTISPADQWSPTTNTSRFNRGSGGVSMALSPSRLALQTDLLGFDAIVDEMAYHGAIGSEHLTTAVLDTITGNDLPSLEPSLAGASQLADSREASSSDDNSKNDKHESDTPHLAQGLVAQGLVAQGLVATQDPMTHVLKAIYAAGFADPDSFMAAYYIGDFDDSSEIFAAQSCSRRRGLGGLLSCLRRDALPSWSTYELHHYRDEIIKSAEAVCRAEMQGFAATTGKGLTTANTGTRAHLRSKTTTGSDLRNQRQVLQNELPNLWSLISELSKANASTSDSHNPAAVRWHNIMYIVSLIYNSATNALAADGLSDREPGA